ncbi:MAG: hypothetical protein IKJ43_01595 [Bacilli bacterium]|nr:hypothetical protein [Bacilli bacterium]
MKKEYNKELLKEALKDVVHYGKGFIVTKYYLIDTYLKEIIPYSDILLVNEPNDGSMFFKRIKKRKLTTIHTLENKYTYETEDYDLLDYIRMKNKKVLIENDFINKKKLRKIRTDNNSKYLKVIKYKKIKSLIITFLIIMISVILAIIRNFLPLGLILVPVAIISEIFYLIYL